MHYEMLFGKVPWNGRDEDDLLKNMLTKKVDFPASLTIKPFSQKFISKVTHFAIQRLL
jgi:hypothetical protein